MLYRITPGDDHEACTQAAEEVLCHFKLIPNPFYGNVMASPNGWACQDAAGTVGLCMISYSIPLNTLGIAARRRTGMGGAGDDGILLHREGQTWTEISSLPRIHCMT